MRTSPDIVTLPDYIPVDDTMHLRRIGVSGSDASDLRRVVDHPANEHLSRFEQWPQTIQTLYAADAFVALKRAEAQNGTAMPYNMITGTPEDDVTDDALLGAVHIHNADSVLPSLSYWTTARAQGTSRAYRGARTLVDYAFAQGIPQIKVLIHPDNTRSIRLAERLGAEQQPGMAMVNHLNHEIWIVTQERDD